MALSKERSIPHETFMMNSLNHISPQSPYYSSPEEFDKPVGFEHDNIINGTTFMAANDQPEDGQPVINFSSFLVNSDQSSLGFDPKDELRVTSDRSYQNSRFIADFSCFRMTSDYSCAHKAKQNGSHGWLYSESTVTTDHSFEEPRTRKIAGFDKRTNTGESTQALKKQCNGTNSASNGNKPKSQKPSASQDPQSIAAKNRRERISERLKVLQELVPNGSKVDLVTMLEKAIGYVKFLQLQVKVLATDEFWPVQGGKAPNISQVREAIDAILSSSQKDRNSSSKD